MTRYWSTRRYFGQWLRICYPHQMSSGEPEQDSQIVVNAAWSAIYTWISKLLRYRNPSEKQQPCHSTTWTFTKIFSIAIREISVKRDHARTRDPGRWCYSNSNDQEGSRDIRAGQPDGMNITTVATKKMKRFTQNACFHNLNEKITWMVSEVLYRVKFMPYSIMLSWWCPLQ